jgi:putative lipoic acid-binding regulatory protein
MTDQKQEIGKVEETLVEFPCDFLIKVMGETSDDFANTMVTLIQGHEPKFDASKVDMRASSGGRFISLTCRVYVTSKPQLDNIYRALSEHPLVKYVL